MNPDKLFFRISPTRDGFYEVCLNSDGLISILMESKSAVQARDFLSSRKRALLIERSEQSEIQLNG